MKDSLAKLLRSRLTQAGTLLAVVVVTVATIAWSGTPKERVQLGGAWVATTDNGVRGMAIYGATDPSGLKSVYRGQFVWPPAMLAAMGLDSITDLFAEEVVTGNNTSESTGIGYGLADGTIALIIVDRSWFTHVSPTEKHNKHETSVYLASADADNDGLPDPGARPVTVLNSSSISKRITR